MTAFTTIMAPDNSQLFP